MERFGALSGVCLGSLRAAAETPDFLAGILDYVLGDESLLLSFAANCGLDPFQVQQARASLSPAPEG